MDDPEKKLSLRRVEISVNNFNDIAIPHHLDLLKKHKANISKFQSAGDLVKIKNEQINATRVVVQLRQLLQDMEVLRGQLLEREVPKFDSMTAKARHMTDMAIKDFMDMPCSVPKSKSPSISSGYSSHSLDVPMQSWPGPEEQQTQLQVDELQVQQLQLAQQEDCLKSWENLQDEVQDLHDMFHKLHELVDVQADNVNVVEENIDTAAVNVEKGRFSLAAAEKYNTVWYPLAGALVGGCLAGPIGLLTGLKLGGLAMVSGSVAGFTGGKILKKKKDATIILKPLEGTTLRAGTSRDQNDS